MPQHIDASSIQEQTSSRVWPSDWIRRHRQTVSDYFAGCLLLKAHAERRYDRQAVDHHHSRFIIEFANLGRHQLTSAPDLNSRVCTSAASGKGRSELIPTIRAT